MNGGAAGGGCGLALVTDVTIAADSSYFVFPFVATLGDIAATLHPYVLT